jgi:hypothetical protein
VELQWRRLREMETGKGRRWGAAIFGRGGGEAAPQCRRRMTQRRAARQSGRLKAMTGV